MLNEKDIFNSANWELTEVSENEIFGGENPVNFDTPPPPPNTGQQQTQQPGSTTINIGSQIPSEFAVELLDKIGCTLGVVAGEMMGYKIAKKQIALDKSEKDFITPAMENYLNTVNVTLSPGEALLVAIGTVYIGKVAVIATQQQPESKPTGMNAGNMGATEEVRKRKVRSDKGVKKS